MSPSLLKSLKCRVRKTSKSSDWAFKVWTIGFYLCLHLRPNHQQFLVFIFYLRLDFLLQMTIKHHRHALSSIVTARLMLVEGTHSLKELTQAIGRRPLRLGRDYVLQLCDEMCHRVHHRPEIEGFLHHCGCAAPTFFEDQTRYTRLLANLRITYFEDVALLNLAAQRIQQWAELKTFSEDELTEFPHAQVTNKSNKIDTKHIYWAIGWCSFIVRCTQLAHPWNHIGCIIGSDCADFLLQIQSLDSFSTVALSGITRLRSREPAKIQYRRFEIPLMTYPVPYQHHVSAVNPRRPSVSSETYFPCRLAQNH